MARKPDLSRYDVRKAYFRGNPRYGRTTTIVDRETGRHAEFMGALSKREAIRNLHIYRSRSRVVRR